jgi:RNA polymerase sigma-70 factor (ECF subfamily)
VKELAPNVERVEGPEPVQSFEDFFEAEHAGLQRALFVVTGNDQEAQDLMQEAFVKVWERWDRVRTMDQPTGYLYRTAMNAFRSSVRRAARAARHLARPVLGAPDFEGADERDLVTRALKSLSERQRAAIVLTEMLDFDSAEAAAMLGVRPSTVRNLAAQARRALGRVLEVHDE